MQNLQKIDLTGRDFSSTSMIDLLHVEDVRSATHDSGDATRGSNTYKGPFSFLFGGSKKTNDVQNKDNEAEDAQNKDNEAQDAPKEKTEEDKPKKKRKGFFGRLFSRKSKGEKSEESEQEQSELAKGWSNRTSAKKHYFEEDDTDWAAAQGLKFDPDEEYKKPERITLKPETKEKLIKAQQSKEKALHNCLSLTACQILRKNLEKILGRKQQMWGHVWSKKTAQDPNLLDHIVQRCLAHTALVGPNYNVNCKPCPQDFMGNSKFKTGSDEICNY